MLGYLIVGYFHNILHGLLCFYFCQTHTETARDRTGETGDRGEDNKFSYFA